MEYPLVSIIIPVYNGSNFMREAIDSALSQTYPNIEILVVNDGSTDDTRDIALSYGDKIRYFEKENGGVSTALNLGIREMKGAYFSWLSHDDWYLPRKIEAEMDALRACGDWNRAVWSDLEVVRYPSGVRRRISECHHYGKALVETGWFGGIMGIINGCTLLIPKSYFDLYGGFDEKLRGASDADQWFRMFKDRKLVYVTECLECTRIHARQVTWNYARLADETDRWEAQALTQLQKLEIDESILTRYQLFSYKLSYCMSHPQAERTQKVVKDFLKKASVPAGADIKRNELAARVHELTSGCYLYCAGRVAKRFLRNIRWRGISLSGLSDSDPAKWGTTMEDIRIIPPSELPKNAKIVVANAFPDEIAAQLREQGFQHVETNEDWDYDLLMAPIKKECCEVLW